MMSDRTTDGLITVEDAAARLGISCKTLMRRIAEAGIQPRRPGRAAVLTEAELEEVLEASRARSPAPPVAANGRTPQAALRAAQRREGKRLAARVRGKVVAIGLGEK